MMTIETLRARLSTTKSFDWMFNSNEKTDEGNKISIQGKSIEDSIELFSMLAAYLYSKNMPFKIATAERFGLSETNKEQAYKAMTIYCVNGYDFSSLCEDVYSLTLNYKGWFNIKTPTSYQHYAGGLFFRNDRDINGQYIPAKQF